MLNDLPQSLRLPSIRAAETDNGSEIGGDAVGLSNSALRDELEKRLKPPLLREGGTGNLPEDASAS